MPETNHGTQKDHFSSRFYNRLFEGDWDVIGYARGAYSFYRIRDGKVFDVFYSNGEEHPSSISLEEAGRAIVEGVFTRIEYQSPKVDAVPESTSRQSVTEKTSSDRYEGDWDVTSSMRGQGRFFRIRGEEVVTVNYSNGQEYHCNLPIECAKRMIEDGKWTRIGRQHRPEKKSTTGLTFDELRKANIARLPLFKNRLGKTAHSRPDGSDWCLAQWANAVTGELGEAANIIKKIERGDMTLEQARPMLRLELADVQTYLDILAFRAGIDLGEATIEKFNEISERVRCDVRLRETI